MKPDSFCTICTDTCSFELVGLLLSLSIYHKQETMHVMTDTKTKAHILSMTPQPRLNIIWHVDLDKYSGKNRAQMEAEGTWSNFQMAKARVISKALITNKDTLFLDSDIVITAPLELPDDHGCDLGVSPQFIAQVHVDRTGYYNGGMLWTNNSAVPDDWIEFTKTSRYFDQASIEDLAKKYTYFEFASQYNLQSWRLTLSDLSPQQIVAKIGHNQQGLTYDGEPLRCVHTHFRSSYFSPFNKLIIDHLLASKQYQLLAIIYRIIHGKWVLSIPKQPSKLPGGSHANDSFRELVPLLSINTTDVEFKTHEDSIHCRIAPNIILYDRPTLQWQSDDFNKASVILLGNGDVDVEGKDLRSKYNITVLPWTFWPRSPMTLEYVLKSEPYLDYEQREIDSIFIGNFENSVQAKYRQNTDWADVITEYHCTAGHTQKFTQKEYLNKLRKSRYGLCLRGFGEKCHREVELMAFGAVPLITQEVNTKSYINPLQENVHYILVETPADLENKVKSTTKEQWSQMSAACRDWYMTNVHSTNFWQNTVEYLLYNSE